MKYKCPCCGYYTFNEKPSGDICKVCFWEDDLIQLDNPSYEGGANNVSLNQARKNYKLFGACEIYMKQYIRKPLKDELNNFEK